VGDLDLPENNESMTNDMSISVRVRDTFKILDTFMLAIVFPSLGVVPFNP
jgi:hypothetical protein